jgi:hypothetical protein
MDHLEEVAREIGREYASHEGKRLPLCLYNPGGLNGSFERLRELVLDDLRKQEVSCSACTLSRGVVPVPDHYNVDTDWIMSRFGVTSGTT